MTPKDQSPSEGVEMRVMQCPNCPTSLETSNTAEFITCMRCGWQMAEDLTAAPAALSERTKGEAVAYRWTHPDGDCGSWYDIDMLTPEYKARLEADGATFQYSYLATHPPAADVTAKPAECANGCPPLTVCDYCQGIGGKDRPPAADVPFPGGGAYHYELERLRGIEKKYQALTAADVRGDWVLVPRVASDGLLMSMAIRYDHALGCAGYYDALVEGGHQKRLDSTLRMMRQLHEEVVGAGFYSAEREQHYAAIAAAPKPEGV